MPYADIELIYAIAWASARAAWICNQSNVEAWDKAFALMTQTLRRS